MNSPGNLDHGPASDGPSREAQRSLRGRAAEIRAGTAREYRECRDRYVLPLCGLRRDVSNAFPPSGGCSRHCTSPAGYRNGESLLM